MMDGSAVPSEDQLDPPARLFERLRQIAGFTWDESKAPLHTSYDNWYDPHLRPNPELASLSRPDISNRS